MALWSEVIRRWGSLSKAVRWGAAILAVLTVVAAARVIGLIAFADWPYRAEMAALRQAGAETDAALRLRRDAAAPVPEVFETAPLFYAFECILHGGNPYVEGFFRDHIDAHSRKPEERRSDMERRMDLGASADSADLLARVEAELGRHAAFLEETAAAEAVAHQSFIQKSPNNRALDHVTLVFCALAASEGRKENPAAAEAMVRYIETLSETPGPLQPFGVHTLYVHSRWAVEALLQCLSAGDLDAEQRARLEKALASILDRERLWTASRMEAAEFSATWSSVESGLRGRIGAAGVYRFARDWDPASGTIPPSPPFAHAQMNLVRIVSVVRVARWKLEDEIVRLRAALLVRSYEAENGELPRDGSDISGAASAALRATLDAMTFTDSGELLIGDLAVLPLSPGTL